MTQLTDEAARRRIRERTDETLFVEAGAGSGKTKSLVDRVSTLVLRGGSGAAASLFFLSPPVTAVLAWVVLDETLSPLQLVGLMVAVVGVAEATRTRAAHRRRDPAWDVGHLPRLFVRTAQPGRAEIVPASPSIRTVEG